MNFLIISDDLSGAAGMASMLGQDIPVIPFSNIEKSYDYKGEILSVDLETRNSTDALEKLDIVKKEFPGYNILIRIDTFLRGSTMQFIEYIAGYKNIALTDTIPEYGRYTYNSYTVYGETRLDLNQIVTDRARDKTFIFDSKTYEDLKDIADHCLSRNLIPVDPGPLISIYLEMVR
jgi:uncharacterized protein YgbK (DUF1537 family)